MTATVREIPLWCGERIGASERFCGPFDRCGRCVEALGQKGCPADCPCRHAQAPMVATWQGPDGFRRGVAEIDTPADVRVIYLAPERLARSRWFKHTSEVS